ncbi:MAG: hypothetical protein N2202_05780 [Proteobacteria bacterium]|nr:hypothetical protein [Pseudomonadota bacterium]
MKIKLVDIDKSEISTIAVYEGGKVWLNDKKDKLLYDNGKEIVFYKLEDKNVREIGKNSFDSIDSKDIEKYSAKRTLKSLWTFTLEEKVSAYTIDERAENFLLSDNSGFLYFYDINKRDYKGRLKLSEKPIKVIKILKNGSLVLVNESCEIIYVERIKIPFFSFLQDLRSSYKISKVVKLDANFISRLIVDDKQELVGVVADHKNIIIFKLPALEIVRRFGENGYIRYADFLNNKSLLYTVTTAFSKAQDNPFSMEFHMGTLAHFFDRTGISIPSNSGNLLLRFENRKELRLYSIEPFKLLVDFGDLIEKGIELTLSPDDRSIILFQPDKNRFGFYQVK